MIGKTPLVSVIIPCYNQGKYLPLSVESALAQTHPNVEVIVVNDGSIDNTSKITALYPKVTYLEQQNRGVAEARNNGFNASKGEFVQFLDADDRLTDRSVEAHLHCFDLHPEAGFVVGEIEWIDEANRPYGKGASPVLEANWYEELLKVNHVANTVAVMFRRNVLETVGGFNSFYIPAEDYEILLRAARTFSSAHHSEVVSQYRRHSTNASRRGTVMLKATNRVMRSQRPFIQGSGRLKEAQRIGDQNWRDFFGGVTIKEIWASLRRGDFVNVMRASVALLRYVRGRIFIIPWKYRGRAANAFKQGLGRLGREFLSLFQTATKSAPVRSSRPPNSRG